MNFKILLISLLLSFNSLAEEVEISMLDVEFGKKLPFPLIISDYKARDSYFKSFRVAQTADSKISQFYDFEVRVGSDLIAYAVKGVRAYSSNDKCQEESNKVNAYFARNNEYVRSSERLVSFKSKDNKKVVSIRCITQEGSPSWYLGVEIYNRELKAKYEQY
ncbi:MAG: hypothetical protein HWE18_12060 [Gammaproteobacteria bacterium]|nr:hypothetical protein [Gammaproteobacteria bacterium]